MTAPDSRVTKVVAEIDCTPGFAKDMLADIEAAGLLVLDPDDEATIERIAIAIEANRTTTVTNVQHDGEVITSLLFQDGYEIGRAILAALRGSR